MGISFNGGGDIDEVIFNGDSDIQKVYLNAVLLWEKFKGIFSGDSTVTPGGYSTVGIQRNPADHTQFRAYTSRGGTSVQGAWMTLGPDGIWSNTVSQMTMDGTTQPDIRIESSSTNGLRIGTSSGDMSPWCPWNTTTKDWSSIGSQISTGTWKFQLVYGNRTLRMDNVNFIGFLSGSTITIT